MLACTQITCNSGETEYKRFSLCHDGTLHKRFPAFEHPLPIVRKPNLHQNCVTNRIFTRIQMAIVDCVEERLNLIYERSCFQE